MMGISLRGRIAILLVFIAIATGASFANANPIECERPAGSHRAVNCYGIAEPCLVSGTLQIKVQPGADIFAIVARHGGTARDVHQVFPGPFDKIALQDGIDRYYIVRVPAYRERHLAYVYGFDPGIEYSDFDPNACGVTSEPRDYLDFPAQPPPVRI